jgi:AAA+ ATPase superfamily predicted ATPase
MKKATIFYGPQGSGKTSLAMEECKKVGQFSVIQFADLTNRNWTFKLNSKTELIVFDQFNFTKRNIDMIRMIATSETIIIKRKGNMPKEIPTPQIIICTTRDIVFLSSRFTPMRWNLVACNRDCLTA